MPKFGGVFSNEGKGTASESTDRRAGMTGEEVNSRLYPRPAEVWRKDDAAVNAPSENTPAAAGDVTAPEKTEEASATAGKAPGNGQSMVAEGPKSAAAPVESKPVPAEQNPQAAPVVPAAPEEKVVSVISRNSVFDGNYATDGDVRVEGEVRGDINCKGHVLICDGAAVDAKISATSVSVAGRLSGEVTCSERFEAQPTARITSQISTPRLVIQEGAIVDGQIRMGSSAQP